MVLRLVNPLDIAALIRSQAAMDVLLKNLDVAGDGVKRRAKLVTQSREKLRLDPVRGFGFPARGLLSIERELELSGPLRDASIEDAVEGFQALLTLPLPCHPLGFVQTLHRGHLPSLLTKLFFGGGKIVERGEQLVLLDRLVYT